MTIDLNKFEVRTIRQALYREASDFGMKLAILESDDRRELDLIQALLGKVIILECRIMATEITEIIRQTDKEYAEGKSVECDD